MPIFWTVILIVLGLAWLVHCGIKFLNWQVKRPKRALKADYGMTGNFKLFQSVQENENRMRR